MFYSINFWYAHLCHINSRYVRIMSSLGLFQNYQKILKNVKLVVKPKLQKMPHKNAKRNTELLELIHSDLCEFKEILTCGRNRYIITFIDDFLKYSIV